MRVRLPEVVLDGLEPARDYDLWVQSLRGAEASEARGIRARTRECPPNRLPPTHGQRWQAGSPSLPWGGGPQTPSGSPISPGHRPSFPHTLGEGWHWVHEVLLGSAAPPAPPRHLAFSDVSHDSARVSWEGTPRPVRLFRISYVSSEGGHSAQVRAGHVL